MRKTSSIIALLLLVVLTTVGMAYGQGFDIFVSLIPQPAFERCAVKTFCPPETPLACWFERFSEPESPDYSALLLARAEKQAAEAALLAAAEMESKNQDQANVATQSPAKKSSAIVTQPDKKTGTDPISNPPAEQPKPPAQEPPPATEPPPAKEPPPSINPLKPPSGTAATAAEKKVFDLVNHARAAEGLQPLILSTDLVWLARLRSEDLVAHGGTLTHNTPTYGNTGQMLQNAGIRYSGCGENLAKTYSPERAVERWLASDKGHRENMLSPNFTHTGVGIAKLDSTYVIISQVFINQK